MIPGLGIELTVALRTSETACVPSLIDLHSVHVHAVSFCDRRQHAIGSPVMVDALSPCADFPGPCISPDCDELDNWIATNRDGMGSQLLIDVIPNITTSQSAYVNALSAKTL